MFAVNIFSNSSKSHSLKRKLGSDNDNKYNKVLKLMEDSKYFTNTSLFDKFSRNNTVSNFNSKLTTNLKNSSKFHSSSFHNNNETNMKHGISPESKMKYDSTVPNTQEIIPHSLNIFKKFYEAIFHKDELLIREGFLDDVNKTFCVNEYALNLDFFQQFERTQFHALLRDFVSKIDIQNLIKSDLMYTSSSRFQLSDISNGNFNEDTNCFKSTMMINPIISVLSANNINKARHFIELILKAICYRIDNMKDVQVTSDIMSSSKHPSMMISYGIENSINIERNRNVGGVSVCNQFENANAYSEEVRKICYSLSFNNIDVKTAFEKLVLNIMGHILQFNSQYESEINILPNELNESCLSCYSCNNNCELIGTDSQNVSTEMKMIENTSLNMLEENEFAKDRDTEKRISNLPFLKNIKSNNKIGDVKRSTEHSYFDISNTNFENIKDFAPIIATMNLYLEERNTIQLSRKLLNSYAMCKSDNQMEKQQSFRDKPCNSFANSGQKSFHLIYSSKNKFPRESTAQTRNLFASSELRNNWKRGSALFVANSTELTLHQVEGNSLLESKLWSQDTSQTDHKIVSNRSDAHSLTYKKSEKCIDLCDETAKHIEICSEIYSENDFLLDVDLKKVLKNQHKSLAVKFKLNNKDRAFLQAESTTPFPNDSRIEVSSISELNGETNVRKDAASQTEASVNMNENYETFSDLAPLVLNGSSKELQKYEAKQEHGTYFQNNNRSIVLHTSTDSDFVKNEEKHKVNLKGRKLFSSEDSIGPMKKLRKVDAYFTSDQMPQEVVIDQEVPSKECLFEDMDLSVREPDIYYDVEGNMKKRDLEWERDKSKVRMGLSRKQRVRPLHPYLRD